MISGASFIAIALLLSVASSHPIGSVGAERDNNNRRGCPEDTMVMIADLYLDSQPLSPNGWTQFFSYLADDIVMTSNVARQPNAVGKDAVLLNLYGINTLYQRIYGISKRPVNYAMKNGLSVSFEKTQGSLLVGIPYNVTFQHRFTFTDDCKVERIDEFADFSKTLKTLSLETGDPSALTCNRIKHVCSGSTYPDFGTTQNNCDLLWMNSPRYIQEDSQFYDGLYLEISGRRTLICANGILSTIENNPQLDQQSKTYLCSFLGKTLPNVPGCW